MNNRLQIDQRWKAIIIYTLVAIPLLIYLYCLFLSYDKGFGWKIDSLPVQLPLFFYLNDFLNNIKDVLFKSGTDNLFYDFRIGLGGDAFTFLAMWYLEPLSFVTVLSNVLNIEMFYDVLVLVRIYLIGLSFIFLCIYEKKNNIWAMTTGGLIYAFSGWTMYYIRHPVFYAGLIYLPILIIGMKDVIKGGRGLIFITIVALSAWTSYYFLYINSIIICIVFVVTSFIDYKGIKAFGINIWRLFWRYILGVAMAMVVLLPNILTFVNSNRTTAHLETGTYWYFEKGWGVNLLSTLIAPFISPGHWLHNGFIALGFVTLFIMIIHKGNRKAAVYCALIAIGFLIPLVTFVFSGFSAIQFRWNYVIGLCLAYYYVEFCESTRTIVMPMVVVAGVLFLGYILILLFNDSTNNEFVFEASVFLLIYVVIICAFYKRDVSTFFSIVLLLVVVFNISLDINYTFSDEHGNYLEEFVDKNKSIEMITSEPEMASSIIEDTDFYRVDSARLMVQNENSAIFLNNHGVSNYVNVMDKDYAGFYHGVENVSTRLLDTLDNDSRTVLEEIESVKYFFVYPGEEAYVPYGYEYLTSNKGIDVYVNKYALPLGYSYSKWMPRKQYDEYTDLEKQEAILKSVVLDEKCDLEEADFVPSVERDNVKLIPHGCEFDPITKVCRVTEPGGYISVEYDNVDNSEVYLRLNNLNIDNYYNVYWKIRIYNDDIDKWVELRSSTATYSYGNYNYLINLGHDTSSNSVNIAFPFVSEFSLDDIEIYHYGFDSYEEDCYELDEDILENVVIHEDCIEGDFDSSQAKICVFSIPYSKGWTAYVDGSEQQIVKANVAFMGLVLAPGPHHILLKYRTPGLFGGVIISAVAIAMFITYIILCQNNGLYHISEKRKSVR